MQTTGLANHRFRNTRTRRPTNENHERVRGTFRTCPRPNQVQATHLVRTPKESYDNTRFQEGFLEEGFQKGSVEEGFQKGSERIAVAAIQLRMRMRILTRPENSEF